MDNKNSPPFQGLTLHGTVVLADDSIDALREKLREDVIKEIEDSGVYSEEAERFMEKCDLRTYISILRSTAPTVLKNTENDMTWNEDVRNHQLLKVITDILCL